MPVKNILSGQMIYEKILEAAKNNRINPTPEEKLLWRYLRNNQINGLKFRRQQIIEGYIVDFYCHQCSLIIEIDGKIHDRSEQKIHDQERETILKYRGFTILHFSNERINQDLECILKEITQFCLDAYDISQPDRIKNDPIQEME